MSYPRKLNQQEQSKARRRSLMVTALVLVFIAGMGAQAVVTRYLQKKPAAFQDQKAERDLNEYRAAHDLDAAARVKSMPAPRTRVRMGVAKDGD